MLVPARLAFPLATWFGCGYSPKAPGTVGTLGAIPAYLVLRRLGPLGFWVGTAALVAVGVSSSERVAEKLGKEDPQEVVIDEVVGALITLGITSALTPVGQALALLLFRALDIAKPGPIRRAEHLQPKGLGIMADDIIAGVAAGTLTRVALGMFGLSRRP